MKNYLIHILLKDFLFWLLFFTFQNILNSLGFIDKFKNWEISELLLVSIYLALPIVLLNIFIFTFIHLYLEAKHIVIKSFEFGAFLHLITIIAVLINTKSDHGYSPFIIATILSVIASGFVYKKLNKTNGSRITSNK